MFKKGRLSAREVEATSGFIADVEGGSGNSCTSSGGRGVHDWGIAGNHLYQLTCHAV